MIPNICSRVVNILRNYYDIEGDFSPYLLPTNPNLKNHGRVLIQEEEDSLFLGIEFGDHVLCDSKVTMHDIAVVSEEISHFYLLLQAAQWNSSIREVCLEALGEVDRFVVLLHWNACNPDLKLPLEFKNIHHLCDFMFTGNRFEQPARSVYLDAETLALKKLKHVFHDVWDSSSFNSKVFNPERKRRASELRHQSFIFQNSKKAS